MPVKKGRYLETRVIEQMIRYCDPIGPWRFTSGEDSEIISGKDDERLTSSAVLPTISNMVRLSSRQIRRWYKHWETFKQLPSDTKAKHSLQLRYTVNWTPQRDSALVLLVEKHPVWYLDEFADKLESMFHAKFTVSSISARLRKLKYSRKVVYEKALQQIAEHSRGFVETMRFHFKTAEMGIFVDESNKDRKAARRKYGWSKIGTPVNYRAMFNRDRRYTFIGAADCFGFVIPACETIMHKGAEKEDHPPVNAERFVEYVAKKLAPCLGNYLRREPRSVVVMDNCSIHMDPRVRQLIEAMGAIIVYSSPYAPELIPIEFMFSKWKAHLKRHHVNFNLDWNRVHTEALLSITPQMGLEYFKKTTLVELVERHPLSQVVNEEEVVVAVLVLMDLI